MNYGYIADLLFPDVTLTAEEIESRYPKRQLPEGAKVTRFAPSPTGFVHFGGLFPTTVAERLAHQSGGVLYLRIEDTDRERLVEGATDIIKSTLKTTCLTYDEGPDVGGDHGPYVQSERKEIYMEYAKKLVELILTDSACKIRLKIRQHELVKAADGVVVVSAAPQGEVENAQHLECFVEILGRFSGDVG